MFTRKRLFATVLGCMVVLAFVLSSSVMSTAVAGQVGEAAGNKSVKASLLCLTGTLHKGGKRYLLFGFSKGFIRDSSLYMDLHGFSPTWSERLKFGRKMDAQRETY